MAVPFIKSWNPSAKAKLAGAPVTADISALPRARAWCWSGAASRSGSSSAPSRCSTCCRRLDPRLRDPKSTNSDQQPDYVLKGDYHFRSIKPQISVLVGICTHLGCSPEMVAEIKPEPFDPNWKGGYFCPCHKSRFDMSGRVFDGVPAPINLLVPPHHYENDNTIVIGVDPKGAA